MHVGYSLFPEWLNVLTPVLYRERADWKIHAPASGVQRLSTLPRGGRVVRQVDNLYRCYLEYGIRGDIKARVSTYICLATKKNSCGDSIVDQATQTTTMTPKHAVTFSR